MTDTHRLTITPHVPGQARTLAAAEVPVHPADRCGCAGQAHGADCALLSALAEAETRTVHIYRCPNCKGTDTKTKPDTTALIKSATCDTMYLCVGCYQNPLEDVDHPQSFAEQVRYEARVQGLTLPDELAAVTS